jgi:hypothetical protein
MSIQQISFKDTVQHKNANNQIIKGKIKKQIATNLIEGYPAGNYLA